MLSSTGNSSGIVPLNSRMVCRTFAPTSRCVRFAASFPFTSSRRSFSSAWVVRNRFAAFSDLDHFADVSKMILNTMPAVETRQPGLLDNGLEISVLRVFENLCQISTLPILIARFIDLPDSLERRRLGTDCLRNFLCHYFFPPFVHTLTSTIVIVSLPKMSTTFTAILRRPGAHS